MQATRNRYCPGGGVYGSLLFGWTQNFAASRFTLPYFPFPFPFPFPIVCGLGESCSVSSVSVGYRQRLCDAATLGSAGGAAKGQMEPPAARAAKTAASRYERRGNPEEKSPNRQIAKSPGRPP